VPAPAPTCAASCPPCEPLALALALALARRRLAHLGAKGWGLLAAAPLAPGALVAEYVGEVVAAGEAEARAQRYLAAGAPHTYLMAAGPGEVVDATAKGGVARFANHSCEPNCSVEKWSAGGRACMALVARRAVAAGARRREAAAGPPARPGSALQRQHWGEIPPQRALTCCHPPHPTRPGEELTYDYKLQWGGAGRLVHCHCGAASCQGQLGAASYAAARQAAAAARAQYEPGLDGELAAVDLALDALDSE
jgi:hypothetical protein